MIQHSPAAKKQYLLVGPWDHPATRYPRQMMGGIDFSESSLLDIKKIHLEWFDYYLKGKEDAISSWNRTKYFILGENQWEKQDLKKLKRS